MAASDEVICLNEHVCCAGRPSAVQQHPEYLELFGDKPVSPLALYTHHHDHHHDDGLDTTNTRKDESKN
jgi:zinc transport system ATP-binding protein